MVSILPPAWPLWALLFPLRLLLLSPRNHPERAAPGPGRCLGADTGTGQDPGGEVPAALSASAPALPSKPPGLSGASALPSLPPPLAE